MQNSGMGYNKIYSILVHARRRPPNNIIMYMDVYAYLDHNLLLIIIYFLKNVTDRYIFNYCQGRRQDFVSGRDDFETYKLYSLLIGYQI